MATTSRSPSAARRFEERDVAGVQEVEAAVREDDAPPAACQAARSPAQGGELAAASRLSDSAGCGRSGVVVAEVDSSGPRLGRGR